jgi:hypothetical protein
MKLLKFSLLVVLLSVSNVSRLFAQDESLLDLVKDSTQETEYVKNAFKSTRIINGQSIEILGAGSLDFRILHRFGDISKGLTELFGLDEASTRLSFDWVPVSDLEVGFGRSSYKKELDGYLKYRILQQSTGARNLPVSLVGVAGMTCETLPWADTSHPNYFSSRLGYFFQALIGGKISEYFSLQLSPTLVHQNLVQYEGDPNDIYALGLGGRIKVTNRISFTAEWYHLFNRLSGGPYYDPFSVGFDIETGGHVFQIHVTNAVGMNERAFITETTSSWKNGQIRFGFNLSRVFQL